MLLIGGVFGGVFYLKGHLPPEVQAYLGLGLTKITSSGVEYEMVPMQAREETGIAAPGAGGGGSGLGEAALGGGGYSDAKAAARVEAKKSSLAVEATEDWGDDGWGDGDDDGWGGEEDMQTVPLGGARVLPKTDEENKHSARFNRNR